MPHAASDPETSLEPEQTSNRFGRVTSPRDKSDFIKTNFVAAIWLVGGVLCVRFQHTAKYATYPQGRSYADYVN